MKSLVNQSDMNMEYQLHVRFVLDGIFFEDQTFHSESSRQSPNSVARTSMVRLWQSM